LNIHAKHRKILEFRTIEITSAGLSATIQQMLVQQLPGLLDLLCHPPQKETQIATQYKVKTRQHMHFRTLNARHTHSLNYSTMSETNLLVVSGPNHINAADTTNKS